MKEKLLEIWNNEKIQEFIKKNRDMIIKVAAAALLVVAAFFVFIAGNGSEDESMAEEKEQIVEESVSMMIMVDIGGEVNHPMVVELKEGSRVEDAIIAAGGTTENADLTEINRAAFVEDGEKILIPSKNLDEDIYDSSSKGGSYATYTDDRININTADIVQLQQLDGIGPVTAEKIIEYREENGRFSDIEEIKNVSGIGEKTFEKFKDDIRT